MSKKEIGEIIYFLRDHMNWKIPRFSKLPQESNSRIWSPKFAYENEAQRFEIAPPGWTSDCTHTNWMKISLTSETNDSMICAPISCIRVGVTDGNGTDINVCDCEWNCSYGGFDGLELIELFKLDEIFYRHGRHTNGYLRLFCEIPPESCQRSVDVSTQTEVENVSGTLNENLKDLLMAKRDADFTIKVQEREFNVHRIILKARSPVFDAMLSHNLKENNENFIEIEDSDPKVFEEFLLFVYTGKTENITRVNVFGLYSAADKYNLPDLKPVCVSFIKKNVTLENIFEVICLSTKHNEAELLNIAINFFASNLDEILTSCKWLIFLKDNTVEANELYIKALKIGYTKK